MSAALLDGWMAGWRHRHAAGSWATSLILHGLLGGVIVWFITVSAIPPAIEAPFRWDVALVSAPVSASAPLTTPASAAKSSVAQPVQAPRATPVSTPAESAAAVPSPMPEAAPLSAPRANTVTSELVAQPSVVSSPATTEHQMPGAAEVLAPPSIVAPVVASAPLNPAVRAVNTGELGDLLWRRMEALKRYPYLARRNGWEGKVLIRVVLGGDGRLLHAEIQESSGHEVLDQDALQVLRAATALKVDSNSSVAQGCASAASAGCAGAAWQQQATFTLPVAYRLQR